MGHFFISMEKNMRSVMQHQFSQVPNAEIQRSTFNRDHGYKTTFDAGWLVPVYVDEALPGDTINLSMSAFGRLATPIAPVMDNMFIDSFFFAVPIRLIWDNWQRFNGEQRNPGDTTDFLVPQIVSPAGGYANSTIHDYFGIPTSIAGLSHSAFWHRAYNLVWNEWFRDQNLQNSVVNNVGDGPDAPTDYTLLRRGKRHDYFTSALPWPQKGPAVALPLGTQAPVKGIGTSNSLAGTTGGTWLETGNTSFSGAIKGAATANQVSISMTGTTATDRPLIFADLTQATAATINQLRQAFQIQRLYERDARGGSRYVEILKAHFGVTSPDARLQRPEYLGGGSSPVNVNPIAQTSATDGTSPQGNLAAIGTVGAHGHGFVKSFTEHCVIIGMVSARADLNYQQGLDRMWSRRTRWDFYWPALAHLGEQTVLNKEIFAQGSANPTADAAAFGYQERYAEYRYKPSRITGQFRSNFAQSLDVWHLAQFFSGLPILNSTFIQDDPPIDRIIAVPSEPHFLWDSYFHLKHTRPMPMYSVPGLIDHF
ncbi:major capsid protein [Blackfly microvirus SF02]|uniref:Major capsid protein n=1 Tax=Blackfly microvirus SF02 TaxID=2576452 RepID=A0A4P8PKN6_9VIRU|nr:major capsid protein [Blackfly microvirus SF02]